MNRSNLRVAAIQYPLEGGLSTEAFLRKVSSYVETAQRGGAQLVVFPELFTGDLLSGGPVGAEPGSLFEERRQWATLIRNQHPVVLEQFTRITREAKVPILWGTLPREVAGAVVNTAWLVFPDGKAIAQDKLYLTPCEDRLWEWKNGESLRVFDAPWGRTAILICHDVEVPELSHLLVSEKPELLLVPSCTGSIRGLRRVRWTAQARTVEHHCYVVQTSTVPGERSLPSTPNMNEHTGQAAFLAPSEEGFEGVSCEGSLNQAQVVWGSFDFELLRSSRAKGVVYPARDQEARARQAESPVGLVRLE